MLTLQWPWLLMLLPLPWLCRLVMKPVAASTAALRHPGYTALARARGQGMKPPSRRIPLMLLVIGWIALLLAAARPTWVGEPIALPTSGRDLLLAVDISGSMDTRDMAMGGDLWPRLAVVKEVVGDFVQRRRGDRLGLILFGDHAYLQTPLTFDHKTLYTLLQEAQIGFAGGATAIGDAIGLAIKRLADRPDNGRVLILLSDGADTASELPPLKAAELAAGENIRIHTIGIGADSITRRGLFGLRQLNPSSDLDEDTMTAIADMTGGRYFRARDPAELEQIYATLDTLEPVQQEAETLRPTKALFYWPLALAMICFGLALIWRREVAHG